MKYHSLKSLVVTGGLSLAVFAPQVFAGDAEDKFKRMDTNGDGSVTSAEHAQFAETMFTQGDADRDGKMSSAECMAAQSAHDKKFDKEALTAHLRMVDTDADGRISQSENTAYARNAFVRADTNSDGLLSEDEFESAHKAMKKEMKR